MSLKFKQLILLIGDGLLFYLALFLALWLRYQKTPSADAWGHHWPIFTLVFLVWLAAFYLVGLYDLRRTKNNVKFFGSYLAVAAINFLLAAGFFYVYSSSQISPKTILALLVAVNLPLFALWRFLMHRLLRASTLKNRALFIGLTNEARELINAFDREPQIGYQTLGLLAEENNPFLNDRPPAIEKIPSFDNLLDFIKEKKIDTVILARPTDPALNRLLYEVLLLRVNVLDLISCYETITHRVPVSALSEVWFLENLKEPQKRIYDAIHGFFDYLLGALMLILLLIFFIPVALIIYLGDRGSIFYHQTRTGKDGRIFKIFKFRTMKMDAEANGTQFTKKNDSRVTKAGKILRLLHLDELPQSLNILKGEMAFIGPRPERPEFTAELQKIMPYYQARHLIKPGLTGWAQVNYDYTDSLAGNLIKLQYDLFYIKNRSLLLDAVILLKSLKLVTGWKGR